MCYNWTVVGDGGGIANHRLDNLIEKNGDKDEDKTKLQKLFVFVLETSEFTRPNTHTVRYSRLFTVR